MMAHESRRSCIEQLVESARITLAKAKDENEAAMAFGARLASSDSGEFAALKFAVMTGMLAVELAKLQNASSRGPGPSPE